MRSAARSRALPFACVEFNTSVSSYSRPSDAFVRCAAACCARFVARLPPFRQCCLNGGRRVYRAGWRDSTPIRGRILLERRKLSPFGPLALHVEQRLRLAANLLIRLVALLVALYEGLYDVKRVIDERLTAQARAQQPATLFDQGRPALEDQAIKPVNHRFNDQYGSGNAEYDTARIARDRPDILDRMKAGEFPSVHAAAKEAGLVYPFSAHHAGIREYLRDGLGGPLSPAVEPRCERRVGARDEQGRLF